MTQTIPSTSFRSWEAGKALSVLERLQIARWLMAPHRLSLIPDLVRLVLTCDNKRLVQGAWVYQDYFFAGSNPLIGEGVKAGDNSMFASVPFVEELNERGVRFEGDPTVRKLLHGAIGKIVPSYSIDTEKLEDDYDRAQTEEKNLVLLMNHLSHLDAPVIDYILRQEGYEPRFVCGSFMFYNPHVRPFTRAFDTIFVFGPNDQKSLYFSLVREVGRERRSEIMTLLETFQSRVRDALSTRNSTPNRKEVVVLFPYAGRATEESGCKEQDGIPNGMKSMLDDSRNLFVTASCFGQRDAIPGGGGGNPIVNFSQINRISPVFTIGNDFTGWECGLSQIHENMIDVAQKGLDRYRKQKVTMRK